MKLYLLILISILSLQGYGAGSITDEMDNLQLQGLKGKVKKVVTTDESNNPTTETFSLKGQRIGYVTIISGKTITEKQTRDANGNVILKTYASPTEVFKNKETYKYDEFNRRIELRMFRDDGSERYSQTFMYDSENRVTEEVMYFHNGSERDAYTYDDKGRKVKMERFGGSSDTAAETVFYKYDDKGNLAEEQVLRADGTERKSTSYTYNSQGDVIKQIIYFDQIMYVTTREFKYDSKGNWIEQTITDSKDRKSTVKRKIEYYE